MTAAGTVSPQHPTAVLWRGVDRGSSQRDRLPILCGVPLQLAADVVHLGMARSEPVADLLAGSGHLLRHLAHQTTVRTERCVGHVRGPILWSETITAWSSGIGTDDVFICGSPRRDFDVPENRLLAWVLRRVVTAGRRTQTDAARWFDPDDVERVRLLGRQAQELLGHRVLRDVPPRRPDGREWRLIRKSRHLDSYEHAIAAAKRITEPFSDVDVVRFTSPATQEQHRVVLLLLEAVRERGLAVPRLEVRDDFLVSGRLRYRNPFVMVDRRLSATNGLYFGDVRVVTRADETPRERSALVSTLDEARAVVAHVIGPVTAPTAPAAPTPALRPASGPVAAATAPDPSVTDQSSASGLVQLPGSYSS